MQGPFSNFADLKSRPAYLSVFLHYLISNSDPSSLLFYIITEHYQSGPVKDLKKWAYEIFSSFIVPTAVCYILISILFVCLCIFFLGFLPTANKIILPPHAPPETRRTR